MLTKNKAAFAVILIALVAATRLFPTVTPPNFSPLAAIALFGSAYFGKKLGILVPFGALILSDLFLNNVVYATEGQSFVWFSSYSIPVYFSFLLIILMGFGLLQKVSAGRVFGGVLLSTILFFLITNLASWWVNPMYTKDFAGVMESYRMGLPFLKNSLLGNLFYSSVLFGIYMYATSPKKLPAKA